MVKKDRAIEIANFFAKSRNGTWDDNNTAIHALPGHEPCWKVSVTAGNETGAEWYEIVSGTPIDDYASMVTGKIIGYRVATGEVRRIAWMRGIKIQGNR